MSKQLILETLEKRGGLLTGDFQLSSGQKSDVHIDCKPALCSKGIF